MNTKGAKTKDRIDLGLGAILAGAEPSKEIEISVELSAPQSESSPSNWTLGNVQAPPKSEFDRLADERRWSEIIRRVESRLEDKSDVEARLWWVRGHLGAFSMPVSFLAAPLESLCRDIQGRELQPELAALLKETALLTLGRLEDVGEKGLAVELRRVFELVGIRQARGTGGRRRVGTSSFRSLESPESLTQRSEPQASLQNRGVSIAVPMRSRRRRLMWTSVCVVVVAMLLYLDHLFPQLRSPTQGVASETFIEAPREVELSRPIQERREPGGRLGALFYSLEGNGDKSTTQPSGAKPIVSAPQSQESRVVSGGVQAADTIRDTAPGAVQPEPRMKESINTEGPVEGPEFKERLNRDRAGASEPRRVESRREEYPPREDSPREELQGGPPRAVLPADDPHGFDNKRTYRVLEGTSVLSAPSYGGRVIGRLERGDRVLVEGKLGRWLRLRSKKGRGGYVLAVDVEELSEPQHPR